MYNTSASDNHTTLFSLFAVHAANLTDQSGPVVALFWPLYESRLGQLKQFHTVFGGEAAVSLLRVSSQSNPGSPLGFH